MHIDSFDEDLAIAALDGDRDALRKLVERLYPRLFAIGWRLLGNRLDAEDLSQDICVALPIKLRAWSRDTTFGLWLYTVIINGTYDLRRRKSERGHVSEFWGDPNNPLQSNDAATNHSTMLWLNAAMGELSEDLRDTAVLVLAEDLSYTQAGEVLGVGEDAITWRMVEVKERLRAIPPLESK